MILRDCKVYFDEMDLGGESNQVEVPRTAEAKDDSRFGDTTRRRVCGLVETKVSVKGLNPFNAAVDAELFADLAADDAVLTMVPQGAAVGNRAFFMQTQAGIYTPIDAAAYGDLVPFAAEFLNRNKAGLIRGALLAGGTKNSTGNGTALNLGAVAADQHLYAALHVLSVSGTDTPTITAEIQSDDAAGMTTATQRATFGGKTTTGGWWATRVAGPIADDWWRAAWTIAGTDPVFAVCMIMGIK
jgi:hypothetical protein